MHQLQWLIATKKIKIKKKRKERELEKDPPKNYWR
jgi:hypothetical protein